MPLKPLKNKLRKLVGRWYISHLPFFYDNIVSISMFQFFISRVFTAGKGVREVIEVTELFQQSDRKDLLWSVMECDRTHTRKRPRDAKFSV